jgi:hypothetical protein
MIPFVWIRVPTIETLPPKLFQSWTIVCGLVHTIFLNVMMSSFALGPGSMSSMGV